MQNITTLAQGEVSPATLLVIVLFLSIPASFVFSLMALAIAFVAPRADGLARFVAGGALALACVNALMIALALLDRHAQINAGVISLLYLAILAAAFLCSGAACARAFDLQPPPE